MHSQEMKTYIASCNLEILSFWKRSLQKCSLQPHLSGHSGTANLSLGLQTPRSRQMDSQDMPKESTESWLDCMPSDDLKVKYFLELKQVTSVKIIFPEIRTRPVGSLSPHLWWWHIASDDLQHLWSWKYMDFRLKSAWEFFLAPSLLTQMWPS